MGEVTVLGDYYHPVSFPKKPWSPTVPASDYIVTGGYRVTCHRPGEPTVTWEYTVAEYGPERRLTWWFFSSSTWLRCSTTPKSAFGFSRCGNCSGTPVTAAEAEILLGWPPSGYEGQDNPAFDALRELVHAST